mgnify:FL=1
MNTILTTLLIELFSIHSLAHEGDFSPREPRPPICNMTEGRVCQEGHRRAEMETERKCNELQPELDQLAKRIYELTLLQKQLQANLDVLKIKEKLLKREIDFVKNHQIGSASKGRP